MPKAKAITSGTPSKKTSKKRAKDPHAPKRYRTAYLLFSAEKREQVKQDNPGIAPKEIMAELAAQWKGADAATKQRFQKLSDAEKSGYEEKLAAYRSEQGDKESADKENHKKKTTKSSKKEEILDDENEESMED